MDISSMYGLGGRGIYSPYFGSRMNVLLGNLGNESGMSASQINSIDSWGGSLSVNKAGLNFSKELSEKAKTLQASITDLTKNSKAQLGPVSGNTDVLTVSAKSASPSAYRNTEINVNVEQVATKQSLSSVSMKNTAKDLGTGPVTLSMNIDGKNTNITANLKSTDNNSTALGKIAEAINGAGLGVTASVVKGENSGESRLVIEANDTGTGKDGALRFSVNSIKANGADISQLTGINNSNITAAQNARFSVDGGAVQESASNSVDIGRGVTASLKEQGTAAVTFGTSSANTVSSMRNFVESFNDFTSFLGQNAGSYPGADKLLNDITSSLLSSANKLSGAGLSFSGSTLYMDEGKVSKAGENGGVNNLVSGAGSLTSRINPKIAQAVSKPSQFINGTQQSALYNQNGGYNMTDLVMSVNQNMYSTLFNALL